MFRVAHGLLRCVQDAEDAVQEALLKSLPHGRLKLRMEDEEGVSGADGVARGSGCGGAAWPAGLRGLGGRGGAELPPGGESAEQSLVGHGERELLRRLIDNLPEELRQPLVLCAIDEMTSREVAGCYGDSRGHGANSGVMRARAELKSDDLSADARLKAGGRALG